MPSAAATCDSSADTPADIDAAVAVWLMGKSEAHRHLFLADLDWRLVIRGQYT